MPSHTSQLSREIPFFGVESPVKNHCGEWSALCASRLRSRQVTWALFLSICLHLTPWGPCACRSSDVEKSGFWWKTTRFRPYTNHELRKPCGWLWDLSVFSASLSYFVDRRPSQVCPLISSSSPICLPGSSCRSERCRFFREHTVGACCTLTSQNCQPVLLRGVQIGTSPPSTWPQKTPTKRMKFPQGWLEPKRTFKMWYP